MTRSVYQVSKFIEVFLKRKKLLASERFKIELQTKKTNDPKENLNLLKNCNQVHGKISISKSVLFETLNRARSPHHGNHEYLSCETIGNPNNNKNSSVEEVTACLMKLRNGKSAGLDDVFPEFLKFAHEVCPDNFANAIFQ